MNKEVIYLESDDDITDILTKLQQAEQKLVALVPPKKATMLRSTVNMKLVARVAKECGKIVVVVTADPAIAKMAMAAGVPVARTLNSRPVIPQRDALANANQNVDVINGATGEITSEPAADSDTPGSSSTPDSSAATPDSDPASSADSFLDPTESFSDARAPQSAVTLELDEDALENGSKDPISGPQGASKSPSAKRPTSGANFFSSHRKWFAIGIPAVLLVVVLLVWAFVFAPSASITVAISSTPTNFSESIRFTTNPDEASPAEGLFYASEQKLEQKYSTDFNATGTENRGERASGSVVMSVAFIPRETPASGFSYAIPEGTTLTTAAGQDYLVTSAAYLSWDGDELPSGCYSMNRSCTISTSVDVQAAAGGEAYNLLSSVSWLDYQGLSIANSAITGGTDDLVKVVTAEDLTQAAEAELAKRSDNGKANLLEDLDERYLPIEASFKAEIAESTSTPEVGVALTEGQTTATLHLTVNFLVYAIERADIETYIAAKLTLATDQRIYAVENPYIERYTELAETARLKAVVKVGPIVTEDIIFEKARGRKLGEVNSILRSINGVNSVDISTPYFWVWSIPDNRDRVTITIDAEDAK